MEIPVEWLIKRAQTRMENMEATIAAGQIEVAKQQLGMIAGILISIEEYAEEIKAPVVLEIDPILSRWHRIRRKLADQTSMGRS